jgi:hypothetical protein
MLRRAALVLFLVFGACIPALGQSPPITVNPERAPADPAIKPPVAEPEAAAPRLKPSDLEGRQTLENSTRMQLIRVIDAEFVHTRKNIPVGTKNLVIASDGTVSPPDTALFQSAQNSGAAAKVGDKVQITNIAFKDKSIYLEINGGPKKKTKWYQHIQIGIGNGGGSGPDPNAGAATGAALTVEFKNHVPEMSGAELKQILSPVLDFSVKTSAEVFADTLPPKIKAAVKRHEVLVGMNHDMVVMAKDRPAQKVREKDDQGRDYEEWIYGKLPEDVVFVRFIGDEVVQVKTAKVSGEVIVKTEKEVEVKDGVPTLAALKSSDSPEDEKPEAQTSQPAHRPTLKRPDENPTPDVQETGRKASQTPRQEEPQWGTNGKPPADNTQPPEQPQTPEPELPKRPPPL